IAVLIAVGISAQWGVTGAVIQSKPMQELMGYVRGRQPGHTQTLTHTQTYTQRHTCSLSLSLSLPIYPVLICSTQTETGRCELARRDTIKPTPQKSTPKAGPV